MILPYAQEGKARRVKDAAASYKTAPGTSPGSRGGAGKESEGSAAGPAACTGRGHRRIRTEREGAELIPILVPRPRETHPQRGEETARGREGGGEDAQVASPARGGDLPGQKRHRDPTSRGERPREEDTRPGKAEAGPGPPPPAALIPGPESGAGGEIWSPWFCPQLRAKAMASHRRSGSPTCRHQHCWTTGDRQRSPRRLLALRAQDPATTDLQPPESSWTSSISGRGSPRQSPACPVGWTPPGYDRGARSKQTQRSQEVSVLPLKFYSDPWSTAPNHRP